MVRGRGLMIRKLKKKKFTFIFLNKDVFGEQLLRDHARKKSEQFTLELSGLLRTADTLIL